MTRIVAILSAYGIASALPIYFVLQPFITVDLPGVPVRYGDLLDLLLTPWIGVGVFAMLYGVSFALTIIEGQSAL